METLRDPVPFSLESLGEIVAEYGGPYSAGQLHQMVEAVFHRTVQRAGVESADGDRMVSVVKTSHGGTALHVSDKIGGRTYALTERLGA